MRNGMTQSDLARTTGYEQAHMSSLELGTKKPSHEFLERLVKELELCEEEREELSFEVAASKSRFALPPDASSETYRFCSALWEKIDRLHPALIRAMHTILTVENQVTPRSRQSPERLRRKASKETPM